jgi:hypothetical protein
MAGTDRFEQTTDVLRDGAERRVVELAVLNGAKV